MAVNSTFNYIRIMTSEWITAIALSIIILLGFIGYVASTVRLTIKREREQSNDSN